MSNLHTSDNIDSMHGIINTSVDEKVYKGNSVARNSFPFIIGLFDTRGGQFCGGSLLTKNYVLTAAHCVVNLNSEKQTAIAGLHEINTKNGDNEPGRQFSTFTKSSTTIHRIYDNKTYANDIAIIKLERPFKLTNVVKTICIGAAQRQATVAGWGISDCGTKTSNILLQATGNVITNDECSKYDPDIAPTKLCMMFNNQSSHRGDSGGPLFHTSGPLQQVGLVSYGTLDANGCPKTTRPDVYTRVNQFKVFIEKTVGQKVFC